VFDLHYSQEKTVPEKALTIFEFDRFTRLGRNCKIHAINQPSASMTTGKPTSAM
jgi:hypothetical protein